MLKVLKSEMLRLKKSKMIYIMVSIMLVLPLFGHGMSVLVQSFGPEAAELEMFNDMSMFDFVKFSARDMFTGGSGLIMAMVIGVNLLCEEYNSGMLKMKVMASSRKNVATAKLLVMGTAVLILSVSHFISSVTVGRLFYGNIDFNEILSVFVTYGYGILGMTVFGILMMNFGFLFKKGSAAIASGLGLYILLSIALQITPPAFSWVLPLGYTMLCVNGLVEQFAIHGLISGMMLGVVGITLMMVSLKNKELTC